MRALGEAPILSGMTPFNAAASAATQQQFANPTSTQRPRLLARQSGIGLTALSLGVATWVFNLGYLFAGNWRYNWSFAGLTAAAAVIAGSLGMSRKVVGRSAGRAAAIAGVVLGGAVVLVWVAGAFVLFVLLLAGGLQFG